MTKDVKFEPVRQHKLLGQQNYFEWRRFLERTAKSMKEEPLITPGATRSKKATAAANDKSAVEEEESDLPPKPQVDSVRSMLKYNATYMDWASNKECCRLAFKLVMISLCEAITIEVEEYSDQPSEMLEYLDDQYAVSTEETAFKLLQQATSIKLTDFKTVIEYINRHPNILMGLPNSYWNFRKMLNFNRIEQPAKEIDIQAFTKLLQAEEEQKKFAFQARLNTNKGYTQAANRKNANKKCTHPGCLTESCWTAHPEKKPQAVKDREQRQWSPQNKRPSSPSPVNKKGSNENNGRRTVALTLANIHEFERLLQEAEAAEESTPEAHEANIKNSTDVITLEELRKHYEFTVFEIQYAAETHSPGLSFIAKALLSYTHKATKRHL
ncbi:hypothetical protein ACQKWADRAFT_315135 [Trichoderma austrokoningii]